MRTQTIYFPPDQQTPCVFPYEPSNLQQAISDLGLLDHYPVIVLIGGLAVGARHLSQQTGGR